MRPVRTLAWLPVLLLAGGCGWLPERNDPAEVATQFWDAVHEDDLDLAMEHASLMSSDLRDWAEDYEIVEFTLGETLRNERAATIETSVLTRLGEFEMRPRFLTHMVREGDLWKVDVDQTQRDLAKGVVTAVAGRVRGALVDGARELGSALEEGLRQLEEGMQDALEDLEKDPEI